MKKSLTKEELFQFSFNPFSIDELTDESIDLFMNRDDALNEIRIFIKDFSTSAIAGEQGVGKSSFLIKLKSLLPEAYIVKYLKITPTKDGDNLKSMFLRTILRALLIIVIEKELHLPEIDILFEVEKLDYSITLQTLVSKSSAISANINLGNEPSLWETVIPFSLKSKLEKQRQSASTTSISKTPIIHNDHSMKETIHRIADALKSYDFEIVLLIDELDKLGRKSYAFTNWFEQIYDLLGYTEDVLTAGNLLFVFALQKEFHEKYYRALQEADGDTHFLGLISEIILLENFSFAEAQSIIRKRLEFAECKQKLEDIFDNSVLKILYAFSFQNTRKFIQFVNHVLTQATIKQASYVNLEILWETLIRKHQHTWLNEKYQKYLSELTMKDLSFKKGVKIPDEVKFLEEKKYIKRLPSNKSAIHFGLNI